MDSKAFAEVFPVELEGLAAEHARMQEWQWEVESSDSNCSSNWHFQDEDPADESTNSEPDLTDVYNYRVGAFTSAPPPPPPPPLGCAISTQAPSSEKSVLTAEMLALLGGDSSNLDGTLARSGFTRGVTGSDSSVEISTDQNCCTDEEAGKNNTPDESGEETAASPIQQFEELVRFLRID